MSGTNKQSHMSAGIWNDSAQPTSSMTTKVFLLVFLGKSTWARLLRILEGANANSSPFELANKILFQKPKLHENTTKIILGTRTIHAKHPIDESRCGKSPLWKVCASPCPCTSLCHFLLYAGANTNLFFSSIFQKAQACSCEHSRNLPDLESNAQSHDSCLRWHSTTLLTNESPKSDYGTKIHQTKCVFRRLWGKSCTSRAPPAKWHIPRNHLWSSNG